MMIIGFFVLCVGFMLVGTFLELLPLFWRGLLFGFGLGFFAALFLLFGFPGTGDEKVDLRDFPEPSEAVRGVLADPSCSLIDAIKRYCDETGVSLMNGKAVIEAFSENMQGALHSD